MLLLLIFFNQKQGKILVDIYQFYKGFIFCKPLRVFLAVAKARNLEFSVIARVSGLLAFSNHYQLYFDGLVNVSW